MAEEIGMGIFSGSEWWDRPRMMPFMSPSSAQFCPAAESFDDICVGNFGRSVNYCLEDIESRSCKKTTTDSAARVSGNNFNFGSADYRIMSSPTTSISNYCSRYVPSIYLPPPSFFLLWSPRNLINYKAFWEQFRMSGFIFWDCKKNPIHLAVEGPTRMIISISSIKKRWVVLEFKIGVQRAFQAPECLVTRPPWMLSST